MKLVVCSWEHELDTNHFGFSCVLNFFSVDILVFGHSMSVQHSITNQLCHEVGSISLLELNSVWCMPSYISRLDSIICFCCCLKGLQFHRFVVSSRLQFWNLNMNVNTKGHLNLGLVSLFLFFQISHSKPFAQHHLLQILWGPNSSNPLIDIKWMQDYSITNIDICLFA